MVVVGMIWGGGTIHALPLARPPGLAGLLERNRRRHDSGGLRLRRMADREFRGRRDARSRAATFRADW